jgi:hypothetical protein
MNEPRLEKYTKYTLFTGVIIFVITLVANMTKQLWNDEIYSLVHFVFVPLNTSLTDYHSTNNHIFFNLINSFYLRLLGINSITILLRHPYLIRMVSLVYGIGTCIYVFKTAKLLYGRKEAFLALSILFTSLAFTNHVLQARGYSLSMMLCSMIFYYHMEFISKPRQKNLMILVLFTALLIYSILSNLWFVLAAMIISIVQKKWKLAGAYFLGLVLAIVLYSPVISSFTSNDTLNGRDENPLMIFWYYMPKLFYYFIAHRYLLAIIIVLSVIVLLRKRDKHILPAMLFFLLPFVFSCIRMQTPPDRIFLFFMPVIAVLSAFLVFHLVRLTGKWQSLTYLLFIVYLNISYLFALIEVNHCLTKNIESGIRKQNLMYNYYLCKYNPEQTAEYCKDKNPVVLFNTEPNDMIYYLNLHNIRAYDFSSIDSLKRTHKKIFFITMFPDQAIDSLKQIIPNSHIQKEALNLGYYGVLNCEILKH